MTTEKEKAEVQRIRAKYPDRTAVWVHHNPRDSTSDMPELNKHKYLTPQDLTVGQFIYVIRKHFKTPLKQHQALFIFVRDRTGHYFLPPTSALMSQLDKAYRSSSGHLEIFFSGENAFGVS